MVCKCRIKNIRCVGYRIPDTDDEVLDYCIYALPCSYKISATDDTETSYINNLKREITHAL